jgi:hypothetical protein
LSIISTASNAAKDAAEKGTDKMAKNLKDFTEEKK